MPASMSAHEQPGVQGGDWTTASGFPIRAGLAQ